MNPRPLPPPPVAGRDAAPPAIDSRSLFAPGQSIVFIEHGGQRYTLRLTRENKLILTK